MSEEDGCKELWGDLPKLINVDSVSIFTCLWEYNSYNLIFLSGLQIVKQYCKTKPVDVYYF